MRASIILWSTASGIILGLFIDATLIGVALLLSALIPGLTPRFHARWFTISAAIVLGLIPLAMAVLGYLEGELKAV
jgi:hypothetical protein